MFPYPRRILLCTCWAFVAVLGGVAPSSAARLTGADLESMEDASSVDVLVTVGLWAEAERQLREAAEKGNAEVRLPLLRLLLRRDRIDEASDLLAQWQGALPGDGAEFLAARIHEEAERWVEAAEAYERSAAREPLLSDHASYRAGLAWQKADENDRAMDAFETASGAARSGGLSARASWRAAGLAAVSGNPDRALENLERIPSRSVIARKDLLDLEVKIYRAQENTDRELRVLREILDRVPSSEEAVEAIRRIEELTEPTVKDRLAFAEAALRNRHATLALEQAGLVLKMLEGTPDPEVEGAARLAIGKALIRQRQLTRAREELLTLPANAAPKDLAEAALDRARCLWRLGQIEACLVEYDAIVNSDSPDEHRASAAWEAGREAKDNRLWADAAARLKEFRARWPKHEYADDAAWHGGRAAAEAGDTTAALAALRLVREEYPDSPYLEESSYWAARLLRTAGDGDGACAEVTRLLIRHPDSYWTQRAKATLAEGCAPESVVAARARPDDDLHEWLAARFPDQDPAEAARSRESLVESAPFRRGELLASLGLMDDAEDEMDRLRRSLERDPPTLLAFAESVWRAGVTRSGMRAVSVLRARAGLPILSGETPAQVARLLYPLDHLDSVLRWSEEYDLDPLFVYAVMREESWFDSGAVSWVGARGLLQIMPSTGRDLARRVGLRPFDRNDLFDPDVNIRLGTFYLRSLLNELDKEPALALSAYNAGKGNALRWRKSLDGDFDVDRYVAGITYRETYNYVQKVTRSWAIYRHLYGDLVPALERLQAERDAAR